MSIATIEIQPRVVSVSLTAEMLTVVIQDGRIVSIPLEWYPRLQYATEAERADWRVFEDADGRDIIFWEGVDEFIPLIALLAGVPSRESAQSLEKWLEARNDPQ